MLSAFSATEGLFGNPFPVFDVGYPPWDCQEPFFAFPQQEPDFFPDQPQEPVMSNSGSDNSNSNPNPVASNSGSNVDMNNSSPGSVVDERKLRRMISNRESARRSRMRKKKHLENLRNHVNRLRLGKLNLTYRLRSVTDHCQLVRRENERLISEAGSLRQRLWTIHQVLLVRELQQFSSTPAWPCNTITSLNEQNNEFLHNYH